MVLGEGLSPLLSPANEGEAGRQSRQRHGEGRGILPSDHVLPVLVGLAVGIHGQPVLIGAGQIPVLDDGAEFFKGGIPLAVIGSGFSHNVAKVIGGEGMSNVFFNWIKLNSNACLNGGNVITGIT